MTILSSVLCAPVLRRSVRAAALAGFVTCAGASPAFAATPTETNYTPSTSTPGGQSIRAVISETGIWESNPLLQLSGAKALYGSITTPEVIISSKTPTSQLNLDALVNENIYNLDEFNSTDLHATGGLKHQMERWGAGFDVGVNYDTTRSSELFPVGLGGILVNQSVRHLGLNFAPSISYQPTTVDKISIIGRIVDSQYEKDLFQNYATASVTPSYEHIFDELNTGVFSTSFQRYVTTSGSDATVDTFTPTIGWIGKLTPRLTAKANVGLQTTRQFGSGTTQVPWTLQYVYSGGITYKGQQDTLDVNFARADYPFGNGTESLLTTFSVAEKHELNELFEINVGGTYQKADYASVANGSLDDLITGTGGLAYHATDSLDLVANYQYKRESLNNTTGIAEDHIGSIGIAWHPRAWSF